MYRLVRESRSETASLTEEAFCQGLHRRFTVPIGQRHSKLILPAPCFGFPPNNGFSPRLQEAPLAQ